MASLPRTRLVEIPGRSRAPTSQGGWSGVLLADCLHWLQRRRPQLCTARGLLRRTDLAKRNSGRPAGVVLTISGGIGKTAAGRQVISRLREDSWLIAVHEDRWNPTALITATANAIT